VLTDGVGGSQLLLDGGAVNDAVSKGMREY